MQTSFAKTRTYLQNLGT